MLLLLPSELQAAVLTPWLEIVDVVNLDSAACNHADRSQWLDSIYSPVYDFASRRSDPDFQPTLLEHVDHNTEVADAYVRWILKHSIRLSSLCITGSLNTVDSYMRNHGRHLTKIEFGEGFNTSVKKLTHIHQFCPNVTHVACPQGFGPSNMATIAQSWPLLQEITLFNGCNSKCLMLIAQQCSNLRSIVVLDSDSGQLSYRAWQAFFTAVNADLRHVRCYGCVDDKTLRIIAQRCSQLRTLEGNFGGFANDVLNMIITLCPLIEAFGTRSRFPPLVQSWNLRSVITTTVSAQSLLLLPALQTLKLYLPESDVRRVIAAITAHCPHLIELAFLAEKLPQKIVQKIPAETLEQLFPPGTLPKPRFDGPYDKMVAALVQRCTLLETLATNVTISAATLTALGAHCHDLRSLRAECLSDGVTDAALSALAEGCSKLRHLRLHLSKEDRHFERVVTALASHCSHVCKVVLDCPLYEMEREYEKRVHNVTVVDETAQAALKARMAQAEADQKVMPFYEAHGNY